MRSRTFYAFAAAGALALPATYGFAWDREAESSVNNEANAAISEADSSYSYAQNESVPIEQTWYYPDGSVVYQQGDTVVLVHPNGDGSPSAAAQANGDLLGFNEQAYDLNQAHS